MNDGNALVVAFDFSEPSGQALRDGLQMLEQFPGSHLHVVWVREPKTPTYVAEAAPAVVALDDAAQEAAQRLGYRIKDEIVAQQRRVPFEAVHVHMRWGAPAAEIVRVAEEQAAKLVVVGTHGRSGVKRWVLGSVAERVVRDAPCPVLVSRQMPPEPEEMIEQPPVPGEGPEGTLGRRHKYHYDDRNATARINPPLVFPLA